MSEWLTWCLLEMLPHLKIECPPLGGGYPCARLKFQFTLHLHIMDTVWWISFNIHYFWHLGVNLNTYKWVHFEKILPVPKSTVYAEDMLTNPKIVMIHRWVILSFVLPRRSYISILFNVQITYKPHSLLKWFGMDKNLKCLQVSPWYWNTNL